MSRRKKKSASKEMTMLVIFAFVLLAFAASMIVEPSADAYPTEMPLRMPVVIGYHVHADFLVVVNDREINFARTEYDYVEPSIHLHIGNFGGGNVMHVETKEATLGDFFSSLGMVFTSACFNEYCTDDNNELKFFVNGEQRLEYEKYRPSDLDKILISYGYGDIEEQIGSVTDMACMFSQKCEIPSDVADKIFYN